MEKEIQKILDEQIYEEDGFTIKTEPGEIDTKWIAYLIVRYIEEKEEREKGEICWDCYGEGFYVDDLDPEETEVKCVKCNGTGRIK